MFQKYLLNQKWHLYVIVISILILSLLPQESFPKAPFGFTDLIVHFVMYSGLALSVFLAHYDTFCRQENLHYATNVFICISFFGTLIEVLQKILPINRYFSFEDMLANAFGASIIFIFSYIVMRK